MEKLQTMIETPAAELLKGVTVWFTGLPSSGKSTIARMLERQIRQWKIKVELLDGDAVRTQLCKDLGFSKEDRDQNIKRIGFVSQLLTRNGIMAIVSAVSPYREARDHNRRLIGNFVEVFVSTPVEECERRDVKGLYKKARAGEIQAFTGVSDPYEAPLHPDLICETLKETAEQSTEKVLAKLEELGYLRVRKPVR